jgi:hypothetical protein
MNEREDGENDRDGEGKEEPDRDLQTLPRFKINRAAMMNGTTIRTKISRKDTSWPIKNVQ